METSEIKSKRRRKNKKNISSDGIADNVSNQKLIDRSTNLFLFFRRYLVAVIVVVPIHSKWLYFILFEKFHLFSLSLWLVNSFIHSMHVIILVELLLISLRSKSLNVIIMCSSRSHCRGPLPAMIFIDNINCKINDRVSIDRM